LGNNSPVWNPPEICDISIVLCATFRRNYASSKFCRFYRPGYCLDLERVWRILQFDLVFIQCRNTETIQGLSYCNFRWRFPVLYFVIIRRTSSLENSLAETWGKTWPTIISSFYLLYMNSHWNVWGRVKQSTKETAKEIRFTWLEKMLWNFVPGGSGALNSSYNFLFDSCLSRTLPTYMYVYMYVCMYVCICI